LSFGFGGPHERREPVRRYLMIKKIVALAVIASSIGLAACNTVRGAGKDVESVANTTSNAINK
jgi:predicted small secreted protein